MVMKIYIRVQKGVDIVAMCIWKKNEPMMHTVCFCGKLLQSRDVFYSTIKQQSLFFDTVQNMDIDIAMRWYNQQYMLIYTTNKVYHKYLNPKLS